MKSIEIIKKAVTNTFTLLIFISATQFNAICDETKSYLQPPGSYSIEVKNGPVSIPFDFYGMNLMIKGKLNGKEIKMLIDNGVIWKDLWFYNSALFKNLGIPLTGDITVTGAGEGDGFSSYSASNLAVTLGGIKFSQQNAVVTSENQGIANMFKGVDGQICGTLFNHFVVAFDFDKRKIFLTRPEDFTYTGKGIKLNLSDNGSGSFSIPIELTLTNGKTIKEQLFIDLGGIYPVSLVIDKKKGIEKPAAAKRIKDIYGASGPIHAYQAELKSVKLGKYILNNVQATYVESEKGDFTNITVGLPLLMNFNLVFDYFSENIYLEPNQNFNKPLPRSKND